MTRIRPKWKYSNNYSITFDVTNVVVHYGISFGAAVVPMTLLHLQRSTLALTRLDGWSEKLDLINWLVMLSPTLIIVPTIFFKLLLWQIPTQAYLIFVTLSTTERREIRNFPYPSMFELTGRQRLIVKKRNRNVGQFLAAEVTNPDQNESQQMFALCDRMDKERDILDI